MAFAGVISGECILLWPLALGLHGQYERIRLCDKVHKGNSVSKIEGQKPEEI